jgi:outer membrane protein assembly factor BamA
MRTRNDLAVNAYVDEGLQYHLGDVRFSTTNDSVAAFPEGELRAAVPLGEGELFNVEKIRKAIENLTKLYNYQGYIDFTVTPQVETDDKLQRILLLMVLDPQKQFRVRNLAILGLEPNLEASLSPIVQPGEIFNYQRVDDLLKTFIDENQAALPPDVTAEPFLATGRREWWAGAVDNQRVQPIPAGLVPGRATAGLL